MIFIGHHHGCRLHVSLKPNCLTIGVEAANGTDVVSYDYAGRLWTAFFDDVAYRRGLNGQVMAKWRVSGEGRQRQRLDDLAARALEQRARALTVQLRDAARAGAVDLSPLAQQVMERAMRFDQARSVADTERYGAIYQPIGILPPDQYMSVVLQATEGCSFNTCTFCGFYKARPFRIKSTDEFRTHAAAVRDFLGDGLSLRRTIFLGDANALVVPMPRLIHLIEAVHTVYDVDELGGLYAFLDGFSGEKKTVEDYRLLRDLGLRRVYIGLESGSEALLRFLRKPGCPDDALAAVRALKTADVAVGVIVLLGAGGKTYHQAHVDETVSLLNQMPLDGDDIVYFSELVVNDSLIYAQQAIEAGIVPLNSAQMTAQQAQIEAGLRFADPQDAPKISRYDIEEFIY